jgi:outer membrane protein assembly factor BamD (BamD/ComL family)
VAPILLVLLCAAALAAEQAAAMEVWTPETGEVELEAMPRDDLDSRRRHATALIGAGQWAGGVAELRTLLREHPDAAWAPEARMALARGWLALGRPTKAFGELAELLARWPEAELAPQARAAQFTCARLAGAEDVDEGVALYERIIERSEDRDEAALAQVKMADLFLEARRYLDAEAEYLALVNFFPDSRWVPHAWYHAALCRKGLAEWLELGLEDVVTARRHLEDFLQRFPGHESAEEAREALEQVRRREARLNIEIARYYARAERRPWAGAPYLRYVQEELAGTPEAQEAAAELARLRQQAAAPLRGGLRELPAPGVARSEGGP